MATGRAALHRIPPLPRPLRPPNPFGLKTRPFTQNSQRLLLRCHAIPRPQIPFLASPSNRSANWHPSRLISTRSKHYIKEQIWLTGKIMSGLIAGGALLAWFAFGVYNAVREHWYPTPGDWRLFSVLLYHEGRSQLDPQWRMPEEIDQATVGDIHERLIARLEDPTTDGIGIKMQDGVEALVAPGKGPVGLDVSAKSEAWRRGYFTALMSLASAAEHLEGWLRDNKNKLAAPREIVKGPSNPNPKPIPPNTPRSKEEDCGPMFAPPDEYYHKVLTTKGFSNYQRVNAALHYQEWLNFKGRTAEAEEVLDWAMDLAVEPFDNSGANVVDRATGVIKSDAVPSENILKVCTALAVHKAHAGNAEAALPIFLSLFRARRDAPITRLHMTTEELEAALREDESWWDYAKSWLRKPPLAPLPSGDETILRESKNPCEIAGLKTYIGEILFTLGSSQRESGIKWSQEAVEEAEQAWQVTKDKASSRTCENCIDVALGNWLHMTTVMAEQETQASWLARNSGWREWVGYWPPFMRGEGGEAEVEEGGERDWGKWRAEQYEASMRYREFMSQKTRAKYGLTAGKG